MYGRTGRTDGAALEQPNTSMERGRRDGRSLQGTESAKVSRQKDRRTKSQCCRLAAPQLARRSEISGPRQPKESAWAFVYRRRKGPRHLLKPGKKLRHFLAKSGAGKERGPRRDGGAHRHDRIGGRLGVGGVSPVVHRPSRDVTRRSGLRKLSTAPESTAAKKFFLK